LAGCEEEHYCNFPMREWHELKAWKIILIKQPMKLLDLEKQDTNQRLAMDM
jgi:hypothetical protein